VNRIMRPIALALLAIPFFLSSVSVSAAVQGGVTVYVDDGVAPKCVNRTSDSVWLTLRRLIVTKPPNGWFTNQTDIAVYLNPTMAATGTKSATFPLLTKAAYGAAGPGQTSIPLDYTLVDSFSLKQGSVGYTALQLDVTLMNENSKNRWGKALSQLADVTKNLPIPATNPYVEGAGYLLEFANNLIDGEITTLTNSNASDIARSGSLAFTFSPDGSCGGDFAQAGTAAILQSVGPPGDGHVDLDKVANYCFKAQLKPIFTLLEAPNSTGADCKTLPAATQYKAVTNNYIAFFLNAVTTPKTLAGMDPKQRKDAETRCMNNGVPKATCLTRPRA
jgi:hypothetical protein